VDIPPVIYVQSGQCGGVGIGYPDSIEEAGGDLRPAERH